MLVNGVQLRLTPLPHIPYLYFAPVLFLLSIYFHISSSIYHINITLTFSIYPYTSLLPLLTVSISHLSLYIHHNILATPILLYHIFSFILYYILTLLHDGCFLLYHISSFFSLFYYISVWTTLKVHSGITGKGTRWSGDWLASAGF